MAQFIEYGEVRRGALGVSGRDLTAEIAKAMKAKTSKGGWVGEVVPGSAADKAGLKSGDIITHLNGKRIESFTELQAKVGTLGVGKEIKLGILREDKELTLTAKLEAKVLHPMLDGASLADGKTPNGENGIVINAVAERSPAAALGLEKGDVIVGVSRSRVTTTKELRDILTKSSGVIALQVQRGDRILYVLIR